MLYGIAQKEQLGFDVCSIPLNPRSSLLALPALPAHPRSPRIEQKAVEECKYRMSRYAVTPNMLIMPPQVCSAPQQPSSARACG